MNKSFQELITSLSLYQVIVFMIEAIKNPIIPLNLDYFYKNIIADD